MTETNNLCGLNRKDFQTTINGKKTDLYILKNRKGYEVAVSNYGGAIVPQRELRRQGRQPYRKPPKHIQDIG